LIFDYTAITSSLLQRRRRLGILSAAAAVASKKSLYTRIRVQRAVVKATVNTGEGAWMRTQGVVGCELWVLWLWYVLGNLLWWWWCCRGALLAIRVHVFARPPSGVFVSSSSTSSTRGQSKQVNTSGDKACMRTQVAVFLVVGCVEGSIWKFFQMVCVLCDGVCCGVLLGIWGVCLPGP
jgi:hypothetical protein